MTEAEEYEIREYNRVWIMVRASSNEASAKYKVRYAGLVQWRVKNTIKDGKTGDSGSVY